MIQREAHNLSLTIKQTQSWGHNLDRKQRRVSRDQNVEAVAVSRTL